MVIEIYLTLLFMVFCMYVIRTLTTTYETTGNTEEALEQIAEYRTYCINQWISLLAFWLKIEVQGDEIKCTAPAFNQTLVTFLKDNLQIDALFDWECQQMVVESTVYTDCGDYATHKELFNIEDYMLKTEELYAFVSRAKDEYTEFHDLTKEDVLTLTKQLKAISTPYADQKEAQEHFFDTMAELMLMMRRKKFRTNRPLVNIYANLVSYLWSEYSEEFMAFLGAEEKPEENQPTESENIEGNE